MTIKIVKCQLNQQPSDESGIKQPGRIYFVKLVQVNSSHFRLFAKFCSKWTFQTSEFSYCLRSRKTVWIESCTFRLSKVSFPVHQLPLPLAEIVCSERVGANECAISANIIQHLFMWYMFSRMTFSRMREVVFHFIRGEFIYLRERVEGWLEFM